jgi:hypothetical protein
MSDDCFRIMTVRLLEPLVFEAIQFTLKLFSNNASIKREGEQASQQLEELKHLKSVLESTWETHKNN